jgi:hypothetical protein
MYNQHEITWTVFYNQYGNIIYDPHKKELENSEKLIIIKDIFMLKEWHTKEDIIKEINLL